MGYKRCCVRSIALMATMLLQGATAFAVSPFDEPEESLQIGAILFAGANRHPEADPGAFSDCRTKTPHYLYSELCRLVLADRYNEAETLYVSRELIEITGLRRIALHRCEITTSDPNGNPRCAFTYVRLRAQGISAAPKGPATNIGGVQPVVP